MLNHDTIQENIKDKYIFAYMISILIDIYSHHRKNETWSEMSFLLNFYHMKYEYYKK